MSKKLTILKIVNYIIKKENINLSENPIYKRWYKSFKKHELSNKEVNSIKEIEKYMSQYLKDNKVPKDVKNLLNKIYPFIKIKLYYLLS